VITIDAKADTKAVSALLRKAASPNLMRALEAANTALMRVAQPYPPPPPGSTYRRTDTLKRGWQPIGPFTTGAQATAGIVNETDYADYVMGNRQAAVHAGRWKTVDQIANEQEPQIVARIEAELDRQLGGTP
jgi:hypothetical protein